jgi:hypothetical protein
MGLTIRVTETIKLTRLTEAEDRVDEVDGQVDEVE